MSFPPIEVDFSTGTIVTSGFLNDRQYVENALSWARLVLASNTVVQVPVIESGATALIIAGQPRLITSAIVLDLSGLGAVAETVDIYAIAEGTSIGAGFILEQVNHGAAQPANSRKLGEADWSGSAIIDLRNTQSIAGHGSQHRPGGPDPLQPPGALLPTPSAIATGAGSPGVSAFFALADHKHPYSPESIPLKIDYQLQEINLNDQSAFNANANLLVEVPVITNAPGEPVQDVRLVGVWMKCDSGSGTLINVLSDHPAAGGTLEAVPGLQNLAFTTEWEPTYVTGASFFGPLNQGENIAIQLATPGTVQGPKIALLWRKLI